MLQALIPSLIAGAVEIIKDKQARKENLTKPSTVIGTPAAAIAAAVAPEVAGMPPDSLEAAVTQIALGIVAVIMFFLRKGKTGATHP